MKAEVCLLPVPLCCMMMLLVGLLCALRSKYSPRLEKIKNQAAKGFKRSAIARINARRQTHNDQFRDIIGSWYRFRDQMSW